ncbi:MAG: HNH endonuclease [Acidimicrobiales bacterium]
MTRTISAVDASMLPPAIRNRVVVKEGCWSWMGWHNDRGYGYVHWNGRDRPVHRVVVELLAGSVLPRGVDVDHLCRNAGCVNPAHLEPVTHHENMLRGSWGSRKACKYGHDWNVPGSVYLRKNGNRSCAVCRRQNWKSGRWST